jgi:hypothetical protein
VVFVGLLVQSVADTMSAKLPNYPVTVVLSEFLDGRSYVAEVLPWSHFGDPSLQAL